MQHSTLKHIGLDDHKDSICVAVADADGGEVRSYGRIDHTPEQVGKLLTKLAEGGHTLVCCVASSVAPKSGEIPAANSGANAIGYCNELKRICVKLANSDGLSTIKSLERQGIGGFFRDDYV